MPVTDRTHREHDGDVSMAQKGWQGNFFEDFELEQELACPTPRTITDGDVATYIALTGDRTPVYCGPSGHAHPLVVFHTVFGQTVRYISLNARANLGYAGIRWRGPVKIGDTLKMDIKIVGLRENSSGKTGIVWVENTATNQRGEVILTFWRWVMIKKRHHDVKTQWAENPVVPEMPKQVEASDLFVDHAVIPSERETVSPLKFSDYTVGERILHFDGQTLNHSDHMSFTRLFQNSAKVHFDAKLTGGKPLIYGGVPISIGYAMAHNGLNNRLGIAAINAGAHTAPLHSNDTIYAFTDVLETVELDDKVGALRLRMIVTKDLDPAGLDDPSTFEIQAKDEKGRLRHHKNVVLDLDYWELIAR